MTVELIALLTVGGLLVLGLIAATVVLARTRQTPEPPAQIDPTIELQTLLANRDGAMTEKVAQLDTKLAELQQTLTTRESALNTQVADIGSQMKSLTGLFTNDRTRGSWGEITMVRIFESAGMVEGLDYDTQKAIKGRTPDAIVHIPGGCEVVIDSKFPQARYLEALEADDPEQRHHLLNQQGKEMETVAKDLVKKHYTDLASGSYVIMYLPSQAVYEAAVVAHPDVLERLMGIGIMVAGPSALFAVLMNIGSLMKEHRAIEQADDILTQAKELQSRMSTFIGHLERVGKSLAGTVGAFNSAVGSWTSNVAPQLARIGEMRGEPIDAEILPIDDAVREFADVQRRLKAANQ